MAKTKQPQKTEANTEQNIASDTATPATEPLLELADILAWSNPAGMGRSLMAAMLNKNEMDLAPLIEEGLDSGTLHLHSKNGLYAITEELAAQRRQIPPATREAWTKEAAQRLGMWFEHRRKESSDSPEFNSEVPNLEAWLLHVKPFKTIETALLTWLCAYPPFHAAKYEESGAIVQEALNMLPDTSDCKTTAKLKADMLTDMGFIGCEMNNFETAVTDFQQAVTLMDPISTQYPTEYADLLTNLGFTLDSLGKRDEAIGQFKKAMEMRRTHLGLDHADTAASFNNIGSTYFEGSRFAEAHEYLLQALDIRCRVLGETDVTTVDSLYNFAVCLIHLKKFKDAYDRVVRFLKTLPPDHPKYNDLAAIIPHIDRESQKWGFRAPSSVGAGKSAKKKKKKK